MSPWLLQPRRILHLSKQLPSSSGIARYGVDLRSALSHLGEVRALGVDGPAERTQRLSTTLRLVMQVVFRTLRNRPDLLVVDLSGRALAEFYATLAVLALPKRARPKVWIVLHDVPSVVGACALFTPLDRRFLRRLGIALSNHPGKRLERHAVRSADKVLVLSRRALPSLRATVGDSRVWHIPHPARGLSGATKRQTIFCPSGCSTDAIAHLLQLAHQGQLGDEWSIRIGHLQTRDAELLTGIINERNLGARVTFTGLLDDDALDDEFRHAAIVLRIRDESKMANSFAASGVLISALAAGCGTVSSGSAGSQCCVELGGVAVSAEIGVWEPALLELCSDPERLTLIAQRATEHIAEAHDTKTVAAYLRSVWEGDAGADPFRMRDTHGAY